MAAGEIDEWSGGDGQALLGRPVQASVVGIPTIIGLSRLDILPGQIQTHAIASLKQDVLVFARQLDGSENAALGGVESRLAEMAGLKHLLDVFEDQMLGGAIPLSENALGFPFGFFGRRLGDGPAKTDAGF